MSYFTTNGKHLLSHTKSCKGFVMVEPRLMPDLIGFGMGRPKIPIGSSGSVWVGGKMVIRLVWLYGSRCSCCHRVKKDGYLSSEDCQGYRRRPPEDTATLGLLQSKDCSRFDRYLWLSGKGQCRLCNACRQSKDCLQVCNDRYWL
jgi:hypothetical protein